MEDQLILVDMNDCEIGSCAKIEAHEKGLLHRAFSIFVFLRNEESGNIDRLLIQKRAAGKYHSAGKWANSCCSHPRFGESIDEATARRLKEETGISTDRCPLEEAGCFVYRAAFDNGLTEYEYDHVFAGLMDTGATSAGPEEVHSENSCEEIFRRNPQEADDMKFVDIDWLTADVREKPDKYAPWFITALPIAISWCSNNG